MAAAKAGHVQFLAFEVLDYNNALQLRVNRITDLDQDLIDLSEYVMASPVEIGELKARIGGYITSLTNPVLSALVKGMFERVGKAFYDYPAASRIHHSYLGGLAEHTLGMADLAETMAGQYAILNRDLLIAGVLVHDLGKTAELGGLVSNEYTLEGKLIGHISICHGWLMETAAALNLTDREETLLLRHMILSHHGKHEFGSPVLPEIPEAEALNLIDNMDARMNTLKKAMETVKPGQWTGKLFSMDNRQFYKADE